MARIAFFVEALPPTEDRIARFAYSLARALAEQRHEFLILSTNKPGHPGPPSMPGIQIARPFRSWSWLEAAQAAPAVARFAPEVLHFVQPHAEAGDGWTNAMSALPAAVRAAIAAANPRVGWPPVVVSFFDARSGWARAAKALIAQADAVTAASPDLLDALRPSLPRAAAEAAAILPLGFGDDENLSEMGKAPEPFPAGERASDAQGERSARTGAFSELIAAGAPLLWVPGDLDEHADLERLFRVLALVLARNPRAIAAAAGGWGRVPPRRRFDLMKALGPGAARFSALGGRDARRSAARAVFAATLRPGGLLLAEAARDAIKQSAFLVTVESQARLDALKSGPWRLCVPDDDEALAAATLEALASPKDRLAQAADGARREASDSPANIVSRLYARILSGGRLRP